MPASTSQLRTLWAPACEDANGDAMLANYGVLDSWFQEFGYIVRPAVTSAANCRPITGGKGHSVHSFYDRRVRYSFRSVAPGAPVRIAPGAAVDVNSDRNPYGPRLVTDMPAEMVRRITGVRTVDGQQAWVWGGAFTPNHDAMHYQPGCGPRSIRLGFDPRTLPTTTPTPEDPDMSAEDVAAINKHTDEQVGRLAALMARQPAEGGFTYAGTDLNACVVRPDGAMIQAVYFGKGEERVLARGLVPTNGAACPMVRDVGGVVGRLDVFGFYPKGGYVIATFDPKTAKWGTADFARP